MKKTNGNAFVENEVIKDNDYVQKILPDVTAINLSKQEATKLKIYLRYETKSTLFESIDEIYSIIGANFSKPSRFLVIPFVKNGTEHLNIQKI